MRRLLLPLLLGVLVIAIVLWIAALPGEAHVQAGALAIDAATPTLVFAATLLVLLVLLLARAVGSLLRLPRQLRAGRERRRRHAGDVAVTRTLVALAAGHQSDALTEAARARKLLGDTPHTLLLHAQAHAAAGREGDAAAHFERLAATPDAALVGLRGLLDAAVARGDWAAAEQLAARAERAYPNSAWLRERWPQGTARLTAGS